MLHEGDKAPAWQGIDQNSKQISSGDYERKWLLLYFYPKDDTPGCTTEACSFRDSYAQLSEKVAIVGVSKDSTISHKAFSEKYHLPFTLIADTQGKVTSAFGADGTDYPKRTTFLIDPSNVIKNIYHGFDCTTHVQDIKNDLGLQ